VGEHGIREGKTALDINYADDLSVLNENPKKKLILESFEILLCYDRVKLLLRSC